MNLFFSIIGAFGFPLVIGFLTLRLFCKLRISNLFIVFFSFPVGCGITSVSYFLCRAFLPFSLTTLFLSDLIIALTLAAANFRIKPSETIEIKFAAKSSLVILTTIIFILLLGLNATYFFREVQTNPYGTFDAYWNWNQKAVFMNYSDLDLREAIRSVGVPRHPIMLSCSVARAWMYVGEANPIVPIVLSLLFCLSLLGMVMSMVAKLRGGASNVDGWLRLALCRIVPAWDNVNL